MKGEGKLRLGRVFFGGGGDENVLELDCGSICTMLLYKVIY